MEGFIEFVGLSAPEDEPLLRELLSYDVQCPTCCPLARTESEVRVVLENQARGYQPSPLHWSRQVEWPWVLKNFEARPGLTVLDVGAGWSVLKYALAKRVLPGGRVVCVDNDSLSVEKAAHTSGLMGVSNIEHRLMDARTLAFPDGNFDRVVCVSVLEHIPGGRDRAVAEMVRVLKPGGLLLLTVDVVAWEESPGVGARDESYVDWKELNQMFVRLNVNRLRGRKPSEGLRWTMCEVGRGGEKGRVAVAMICCRK